MTDSLKLHRLIRSITSTTWNDATWPKAKAMLRDSIAMQGRLARSRQWN